MKEAFLICALALPCHLDKNYKFLVECLEHDFPGYSVILVNERESAVGPQYYKTPYLYKGARIWLVKSA